MLKMSNKIEVDKNKLVELYNNGFSEREIAKQMNLSRSTVRMRLVEFGLLGNKNGNLESEYVFKNRVVEMYKQNLSISEISKNLNSPNWIIKAILKQNGYKFNHVRFHVNDNFFANPDIINSYWAGFLAADGWVENNDLIGIELSIKDIEHLKYFLNTIKFTGSIKTKFRYIKPPNNKEPKWREFCYLRFVSNKIKDDLENNFNIVPRKSLILEPPLLDKNLAVHFIRGYIDGDGSYCRNYPLISIRGTKSFLEWIKTNIRENCKNVGNPKVCWDNGTYKLQFNGSKQFKIITEWLFSGSNEKIRLDRKYKIIEEHRRK